MDCFLNNVGILQKQVERVQSFIHHEMSSRFGGPTKIQKAVLHFDLTDGCGSKSGLTLEFTREELENLYETLETIQREMDKII